MRRAPGRAIEPAMDDTLIRYADVNVPRYTSYPTAAHFDTGVGEAEARIWLRDITIRDRLSLYAHIPFCESLCWYCGCHTSVPNGYGRVERYLATLRAEIDRVADLVPDNGGVAHLHFGGGTPNYLKPADFVALTARLRQRFVFLPDAEIAVEVDPRTLDDAMIRAFQDAGVNRVSLGVQDFDSTVQALIQRDQPFELVAAAVDALRKAGLGALSFDLMYGLPGQTRESAIATARRALALMPDRFSVFGYAHVPWFKKNQRAIDEARLPDTADRLAQNDAIAAELRAAGYDVIGFDHFALPGDPLARAARTGKLQRNFQGYTNDPADVLLGFGASAISTLPGGQVQNEPRLDDYAARIGSGGLAAVRGVALTSDDRLRAAAIERIMCDLAVDLDVLSEAFGKPSGALDDALPGLQALARDGLVRLEGRRLRVLEAGRRFLRNVAYCLDARTRTAETRHSRAV